MCLYGLQNIFWAQRGKGTCVKIYNLFSRYLGVSNFRYKNQVYKWYKSGAKGKQKGRGVQMGSFCIFKPISHCILIIFVHSIYTLIYKIYFSISLCWSCHIIQNNLKSGFRTGETSV